MNFLKFSAILLIMIYSNGFSTLSRAMMSGFVGATFIKRA